MSEKTVKSEQKKPFSKVFKWILIVLAVVILEVGTIAAAVMITESQNREFDGTLQALNNKVTNQTQQIAGLQRLTDAINANAEKIAENAGNIKLATLNLENLKNEVGYKKIDIITQQLDIIEHRMESVEESKSREALVLSLALIIKENALYNRDFQQEAEILNTLSRGQDEVSQAVQTINSLKGTAIASDTQLIDEFKAIAADFSFEKQPEKQPEQDRSEERGTVSKSIEMIKDTVAGINFDKVVILKKDKKTEKEKLLLAELGKLVNNHNFGAAITFINDNPSFQAAENQKLNEWINKSRQKIAFDEAVSLIIATELNAIREDFKAMKPIEPHSN